MGYKVYYLGHSNRFKNENEAPDINFERLVAKGLDQTVKLMANEITKHGGIRIAVPCDLAKDRVVDDILVNRVAKIYVGEGIYGNLPRCCSTNTRTAHVGCKQPPISGL